MSSFTHFPEDPFDILSPSSYTCPIWGSGCRLGTLDGSRPAMYSQPFSAFQLLLQCCPSTHYYLFLLRMCACICVCMFMFVWMQSLRLMWRPMTTSSDVSQGPSSSFTHFEVLRKIGPSVELNMRMGKILYLDLKPQVF